MLAARDVTGEQVLACDAERGETHFCPECEEDVHIREPVDKITHFYAPFSENHGGEKGWHSPYAGG